MGKRNSVTPQSGPTYIGNGMKVEGKVHCTGPVRIDGEVHGSIDCEGTVAVGATARIVATIRATCVMINGRVEGNIFTTEQLEVLPEGYITGNVSNPRGRLVIHEGAVIEGQCLTYEAKEGDDNSVIEVSSPKPMLENAEAS